MSNPVQPHETRTATGLLHFLTPEQMAEEIVRLDATIAAHPTRAEVPEVVANFLTESGGLVGTTSAKVHSVTWADDGALVVEIDHWPQATQAEAPKRCRACNNTGLWHCSDPVNCGGPWDTQAEAPSDASSVRLSPLPAPDFSERVYGGHGNEIVYSYFEASKVREYARQEVYRAEDDWRARAALATRPAPEQVERDREDADLLKDIGLLLHHFWCDVQMNEYSFKRLTDMMDRVDAAIVAAREAKKGEA